MADTKKKKPEKKQNKKKPTKKKKPEEKQKKKKITIEYSKPSVELDENKYSEKVNSLLNKIKSQNTDFDKSLRFCWKK